MARYQAILAYDGTDFKGYQRQAGGRTVQNTLESALKKVGWSGEKLLSAGRTDSGVHATGQVAAFDLEWNHTASKLLAALNAHLPDDLAVKRLVQVSADFHPRYDAAFRSYEYRLFMDSVRDPRRERFAWRVWPEVELESMQQAASYLPGRHDFRSFGRALHKGGSTERVIYQAEWDVSREDLVFRICGNAFLFRMVRRLVGFLVEIGQRRMEPVAMHRCLLDGSGEMVKTVAPAHGLTLVEVGYTYQVKDSELSR